MEGKIPGILLERIFLIVAGVRGGALFCGRECGCS